VKTPRSASQALPEQLAEAPVHDKYAQKQQFIAREAPDIQTDVCGSLRL
jgi:hypothetical protein